MNSSSLHPRLRRAPGFTLVELLVALIVSGILVTVVLSMVTGQSRFVQVQSAREEVQQNARGALELVSGELRSVSPGTLLRGDPQAIEFLLPRVWGLACGTDGGQFLVVFPDVHADLFTVGTATGLVVQTGGGPFRPDPHLEQRAAVTAAQLQTGLPGTCADMGVDGDVRVYRFTGDNLPAADPGDRVAVYQHVRYDIGEEDGRDWLRRNTGLTNGQPSPMQPLAGPVDEEALRFEYLDALGNVVEPGVNAALLTTVRMVRFHVRTQSRSTTGAHAQTQQDSVTVSLRN